MWGFIFLGGIILAATGNLTEWWGIALIVTFGLIAILLSLSVRYPPVIWATDAFLITPAAVGGVFLGYAIFDTWWGVAIGAIALGFVGTTIASIVIAGLEQGSA